jgi:hypothetical protein
MDKERYLSPYTADELRVALPYMLNVNNTTFNEAMERTYDVGMIPKYVLNDIAYQERKQQIEKYVQLLKSDPNEMERLLNWNGMTGTYVPPTTSAKIVKELPVNTNLSSSTIDDTLEVDGIVIGRIGDWDRLKIENPVALTPTRRQSIPQSPPRPGTTMFYKVGTPLPNHIDGTMILSLNTFEAVDRATPFGKNYPRSSTQLIGYNGDQNVLYMRPKMTIAAPLIYDTLVQHYMNVNPSYVVALWDKVGGGHHNGMNHCIPDLFWQFVLHQRDKVDVLPKTTSLMKKRSLLHRWRSYKLKKGSENTNPMSEWHVPIAMKGRPVRIDRDQRRSLFELKDIFPSDKHTTPTMVRMDTSTQNIIHFAGPGRVVYQIVNDYDLTINYTDMIKILVYGKYLLWNQKVTQHHDTIVCAPNPPIQPLEWYFIVPASSRTHVLWEQRAPTKYILESMTNESTEQRNERRVRNRNMDQVNHCIQKHVVQYVLVMDVHDYNFSSSASS